MASIQVDFRYGMSVTVRRELEDGTTVRSALRDAGLRARLNMPESVTPVVNGNTVSLDYALSDGDEVVFEKQAASKAAGSKKPAKKPLKKKGAKPVSKSR